jgi:DNA polymerase I-like protein with 3'-5' exonuclease and polymerase domains
MGMEPIEFTKKGLPKIDTDSLKAFGPGGEALETFHLTHKELSFVVDFIERTQLRPTIHPGFRTPGTVTGRLSGVEPNIQQVPKSRRFLQCLRARPGHVWIDADVTSLEPVVCTELSGDEQLMRVFGPDSPPGSDIYLHTGAGLPQFRDQIVAAGYDPDNLTPEGAAAAKKLCKAIRGICKVLYLSSSYGAGPKKICKTLKMQGVPIELDEVQEMHTQYWEYYQGIKRWEKELKQEHRQNKGWVMNGIGRPIGVHQDSDRAKDKRKDIVNRVVQSTGHDLLVQYLRILSEGLDATGIKWYPIIWDFHDECIVEVPEAEAEMAMETFREAQDILNKELGGTIPLKINPVVVRTLADAKLED